MPLPGVSSWIADGQLRIPPTVSGPKIIVVGTTTNTAIPKLEPIGIADHDSGVATCRHLNGDASELSLALDEVLLAGAQNVEIMVIEHTSGELDAYTANSRWDANRAAYEALRSHPVDFIHPVGAYLDDDGLSSTGEAGETRTNFGRQLADFCYLATKEGNPCFGVIGLQPITRVARLEAWSGAPADLSGEFFATPSRDDVTEWMYHLTGSASGIDHSSEELTTRGWLAGSTETAPGELDTSYDFWARDSSGVIAVDQFGGNVDGGAYLAAVAGLTRVGGSETRKLVTKYEATDKTTRNSNGAAAFAGQLTRLDPHVGSTNKPVQGLSPARQFNRAQVGHITGAETETERTRLISLYGGTPGRYITFHRNRRGYVVVQGNTAAYNASDFTRSDYVFITTRLIVHSILDQVAKATEPYIGEANNEVNRSAMDEAVDATLNAMKKAGALRGYVSQIRSTPYEQVLGRVNVYLKLIPAFEIREIRVYIALAAN